MKITPYLYFNGTCEEAFKYYEKALGGKITTMMPNEGSPAAEHTPENWLKKILHASMTVGDQVLMASDAPPGHFQTPQGFTVSLEISNAAEAERVFKALAVNGLIKMPLTETFWAHCFGMVVDQFGTPWMINCGKGG